MRTTTVWLLVGLGLVALASCESFPKTLALLNQRPLPPEEYQELEAMDATWTEQGLVDPAFASWVHLNAQPPGATLYLLPLSSLLSKNVDWRYANLSRHRVEPPEAVERLLLSLPMILVAENSDGTRGATVFLPPASIPAPDPSELLTLHSNRGTSSLIAACGGIGSEERSVASIAVAVGEFSIAPVDPSTERTTPGRAVGADPRGAVGDQSPFTIWMYCGNHPSRHGASSMKERQELTETEGCKDWDVIQAPDPSSEGEQP